MANKKDDLGFPMSREDLSAVVAEKIAKALPDGFVAACIEEAIRKEIVDFKVDSYTIQVVMKEVVLAKTKELLKTKYTAQVEAAADALAQKALVGSRY